MILYNNMSFLERNLGLNSSLIIYWLCEPCYLSGKESACNTGDVSLIPGLGRSLEEGNDNSLQYSCLENPMDRGAWQAVAHRVAESDTTERLSTKEPYRQEN